MQISSLKSQFVAAPVEGENRSVCLLVHGRTGRLDLLKFFTKRFKVPGMSYLMIEAPHPETRNVDSEQPHFKKLTGGDLSGYSWFLGRGELEGLDESRKKIRQTIKEVTEAGYSLDLIYWLGFSQGGVMGLDYFLRADQKLGGLILVSGYCLSPEDYPQQFGSAAREQNLFITHGERDEIISLEEAQNSYKVLKKNDVPHDFKVYSKRHSFDLRNEIPDLENTLISWASVAHN